MVRYVENRKSMAAFLMSEQLFHPVRQVTRRIHRRAVVIAEGYRDSGDLARSYEIGSDVAKGPAPGMRWSGGRRRVGTVSSNDPAAAPNEFGNGKVEERRILRRAGAKYHVPIAVERTTP